MGAFLAVIGRAIYVLAGIVFWGAAGVYNRIAPWAPTYLWSLAITAGLWLALIPTFVIVKVLTGWAVAAYLAAFLAALLSAVLGALGTPIGILVGLLTGKSREAGAWYVRLVGVALFTELMLSLYLLLVPFHRNLGAVPLLILAAIAVGIGTALWGGWLSGRFYTGVAAAIAVITTLSFLFPETFQAISGQGARMDASVAGAISGQPMRLLLWGAAALILAAYVAARALDKPWLKSAAWGLLLLGAVVALADYFIWSSGASSAVEEGITRPWGTAASSVDIRRFPVPLKGQNQWVSLRGDLPPCTRVTFDSTAAKSARVRFEDGGVEELGHGREFGRQHPSGKYPDGRNPEALDGEGTVYVWLTEIAKKCS